MNNNIKKAISVPMALVIMAGGLIGFGVGSYIGDKRTREKSPKFPDKSISCFDEQNNEIKTLVFVNPDGKVVGEEKYGYLNNNEFYDVISNNTYKLFAGDLKDYTVYYADADEFIYNYIDKDANDCISYNELKTLEE